ncbi:hypothetical protein KYK30_30165 [Shinella yambaruensis]|uniref:Uncharacterized protein n=1 Tax=Shinella yambaruensis TaxID=415996 RepID=A0ABQ5ZG79_9HYPH|nr:hypothetical protein [Shinella yambaruensis]MCJ8028736.1 hypothetical protein [Shinella yambaruensis]MCU7983985.1 hypothetical protein [Shinella yambaruensis]GLR49893.1 hypothetical protein GCM10007923_10980 [Shinella yambaruensis]
MAGTFLDLFRGMGTGGAGGNQMTASAPQQAQGGFFDRLDPDLLLSISTGLLTGKTTQEQLGNAAMGFANYRKDARQRNRTLEILGKDSPQLVQAVEAGILTPSDAFSLHYKEALEAKKAQRPSRKFQTLPDGTFGWADENAGTWMPLGTAPKEKTQPALAQEYQFARENGFEGGFTDYVQLKRSGGGSGDNAGFKVPGGYRLKDPANPGLGVEPIPGGPAEEMPGELAARVGMAKSFIARAPDLRRKIQDGQVTGWWDQAVAEGGYGEKGQIYQDLQSGTDALMRLMTGAGMNETEARQYASRYLPSARDTAWSAASKLDRLVEELEATAHEASRGRGGFQSPRQRSGRIDDLVRKYGG